MALWQVQKSLPLKAAELIFFQMFTRLLWILTALSVTAMDPKGLFAKSPCHQLIMS